MLKNWTVAAMAGVLLAGCGLTATQQDAAQRFARASSQLGLFSAHEFSRLRQATVTMNSQDMALTGSVIADLDEAFDVERVAVRVAAAHALAEYGDLLQALLDETQTEQLQQAAGEFVVSFKQVSDRRLTNRQLDALGTAVQELGIFGWSTKKRRL